VTDAVFLDTGVLGIVTHPRGSEESRECIMWMYGLLDADVRVCVPEVCDYELRREYVLNSSAGDPDAAIALSKLNSLIGVVDYIPIDTAAMREAASMWATARRGGFPSTDPKKVDFDVILCAQARLAAVGIGTFKVATTNIRHLNRFVPADAWQNVRV